MDMVNEPWSTGGDKYAVLLSFGRDQNTRESFSSRLYWSLREDEISVVKDDISIESLRSIMEGSEISIIIFSKYYGGSRRCLRELTKIMEFRRARRDHVVIPIFYGVDQSEVRNQESSFGEAFRDLIQWSSPTKDEVSRWRTALSEAAGLYGSVVPNFESRTESKVIQIIVNRVGHILRMKANPPVGVNSHAQDVITMLDKHQSTDVLSIGIWGMGGIGKTTIAKAIFHQIQYEFESICFLSNVSEKWERKVDLVSEIREATDMGIYSIEPGSLNLKERLCHEKVLLVIDDVNHLEQLHALCASRDWFGEGSRIIITTRDLHVLHAYQVGLIYSVKLLSDHESLQQFHINAFKQVRLDEEFRELCRRMVAFTEGLPLALAVLGSIFSERSPIEWESTLVKLSQVLRPQIYNRLKLSYDSLDGNQKEIFLKIVLFYIGEDIHDVIQKLEGQGCNASIGIRVLEDRSLVTFDNNQKLRMHNLLQLMGRQIIRESSKNELRNREEIISRRDYCKQLEVKKSQ